MPGGVHKQHTGLAPLLSLAGTLDWHTCLAFRARSRLRVHSSSCMQQVLKSGGNQARLLVSMHVRCKSLDAYLFAPVLDELYLGRHGCRECVPGNS